MAQSLKERNMYKITKTDGSVVFLNIKSFTHIEVLYDEGNGMVCLFVLNNMVSISPTEYAQKDINTLITYLGTLGV
jgi:hypothetical protein